MELRLAATNAWRDDVNSIKAKARGAGVLYLLFAIMQRFNVIYGSGAVLYGRKGKKPGVTGNHLNIGWASQTRPHLHEDQDD